MEKDQSDVTLSTISIATSKTIYGIYTGSGKDPVGAFADLQKEVANDHHNAVEGIRLLKIGHKKYLAYGTAVDVPQN